MDTQYPKYCLLDEDTLMEFNKAIANMYVDIGDEIEEYISKYISDWSKEYGGYNNMMNKEQIIKERCEQIEFYVLEYDTTTTEYVNDIEFSNYNDAKTKYNKTDNTKNITIELIFAPERDDDTYFENVVLEEKQGTL